jgi:hypothetical protein
MGVKENRERITGQEEYFTDDTIVTQCLGVYKPFLRDSDVLIEPAAGDGAFLKGLKRANLPNSVIAYDIDPKVNGVQRQNFLTVRLTETSLCAITNPPFGRANSLSVKFFNHLAPSCRLIGFIVPISWRKWSIVNRLNRGFHLVSDTDLPNQCFHRPDGTPLDGGILKTVFQVWQRRPELRPLVSVEDRGYFTKASPRTADVAYTAFGYKTGMVETNFKKVPNTCKLFLKVKDPKVVQALRDIDISPFTRNCAYTACVSMQELRYLLNEYFDSLKGIKTTS